MEAHVGTGVIRGEGSPSTRGDLRRRIHGFGSGTRRVLKALVIGLMVQHWIFIETESIPSLAILIISRFPYWERLEPYLTSKEAFYYFAAGALVLSLIWLVVSRRWQPELEPSQRPTLSRILSYLKPHWRSVVATGAAIIATASLELAPPIIIGLYVFGEGGVIQTKNPALLPWVVTVLVVVFGAKQIATFSKEFFSALMGQRAIHSFRSDAYEHIEHLPVRYFDSTRTGEMVSRVVTDTNELEKVLTDDLAKFAADAVMVVGAITVLFLLFPRPAAFIVPVVILIVLVVNTFKRAIKRASKKIREAFAELTARSFEVLSGIRIVKSFRMEGQETREFKIRSVQIARAKIRLARLSGVYQSTVDMLTALTLIVAILFAVPTVAENPVLVGTLYTFIATLEKLFKPLVQLSKMNIAIQKAVAAADRVFEVMDLAPEVRDPASGLSPAQIEGRIQFDHVSFGYRTNRKVLEDFSLVIEPGETVAVVGSSGAGKSTVVNLLLRFYEPTSGRILIDEYPIDTLNLGFLRNKIGLVLQEPVLFSGTIRENIGFGKPAATPEEIIEAAKLAHAHEFVSTLPNGYDTQIGERGATLSVGQRQRIAIARALVKNPSLLILDEATSNIDSKSESLIQDALDRLAGRRTIIVIGHRLSSIMDADRIVVLAEGGIAEIGTHEDLIGKGGTYTRLYEAQLDRGSPTEILEDEMFEEDLEEDRSTRME